MYGSKLIFLRVILKSLPTIFALINLLQVKNSVCCSVIYKSFPITSKMNVLEDI